MDSWDAYRQDSLADRLCKAEERAEAAEARLAAVEALCDRIYTEARSFEAVSDDGDVAMGTRIHMVHLVRAALRGEEA